MKHHSHVAFWNRQDSFRTTLGVILICSTALGCRREPSSPSPAVGRPQTAASGAFMPPSSVSSPVEEMYRRVGTLAPSFGGFYLNDSGDPTVVLLDPSPAVLSATRAVMDQVFGPKFEPQFSGRPWHAVQGQFNYVDLANWRDTIAVHLNSLFPVVSGVGLDQEANRVNVGLPDTTKRAQAEALIVKLGVPLKGIIVERGIIGRPGKTILDRQRAVPGGVQFATAGFSCTLGVNAQYTSDSQLIWYFMTAAHCPDPNDLPRPHPGALAYQPGTADTNLIGSEATAAAFDTSSPDCNPNGCTNADVALYTYNTSSLSNFGYMVNMAALPAGNFGQGTLQIATPDSVQSIDQVEAYEHSLGASKNQVVYKIGMTTGYTKGTVQNLCYTSIATTGVKYNCQVLVYGALANGGDSGGPVVVPAKLYGIMDLIFDQYGFSYSSMTKIYEALGIDPIANTNTILFCFC
jgi:Trypsin